MKKRVLFLIIIILIGGCSSTKNSPTPEDEQTKYEEEKNRKYDYLNKSLENWSKKNCEHLKQSGTECN